MTATRPARPLDHTVRRHRHYGNCPVCGWCAQGAFGGVNTPRHGHIKTRYGWLPPCPGSGKPMANLLTPNPKLSGAAKAASSEGRRP